MLKYFKNILTLLAVICMVSCHKGDITLLTQPVVSNTSYDLNSIAFVNDSLGYICGGSRYFIGVVIKTTDGGKTWSASDSVIPKALYTMNFFSAQEALMGGFDGILAYTNDSAKTFSSNHVTGLPALHLSFSGRQKGVAACGLGDVSGAVYNTLDGGTSWTKSYNDTMHSMNGAVYLDDTTVIVCGYGTILRSHNSGASYTVVRENGDFYQSVVFAGTTIYGVGYQGEVIKSTDRGLTWHIVKSSNGLFSTPNHLLGVDFIDDNNGYAVGESGYIIHTSDGGLDWQVVRPFTSERLSAVHMFSATSGIVAGAGGKVYLFQE